jgi:hypothetical protein
LEIPLRAFIAFKCKEASSSDYPPDKKVTAGNAGTIVLDRVLTVIHATSSGDFLSGHSAPGVTIFGLSKVPSIISLWSIIAFITAANTLSDTSAHLSMVCLPS